MILRLYYKRLRASRTSGTYSHKAANRRDIDVWRAAGLVERQETEALDAIQEMGNSRTVRPVQKNSLSADMFMPNFSPYAQFMVTLHGTVENKSMKTPRSYFYVEKTSPLNTWYTVRVCHAGSYNGLRCLPGHQPTLKRV